MQAHAPPSSPVRAEKHAASAGLHPRWMLLAFYALAPWYAKIAAHAPGDRGVELFVWVMLSVILSQWAFADAHHRGQPIPAMSRGWFLLFAACVVPGYVIQTRGWRGVGLLVVNAIAWTALGFAAAIAWALLTFAMRSL